MKFLHFIVALGILSLAGCNNVADQVRLTCHVVGLGDKAVVYNHSTDGYLLPQNITPEIGADSTFVIVIPGHDVQKINLTVRGKGSTGLFLSPGDYELTIKPSASDMFIYGDGFGKENIAACEAVQGIWHDFWEYIMGHQVRGLKGDTVATSVETKLLHYSDSVARVIGRADSCLHDAMKAQADMAIISIFNSAYNNAFDPRKNVSAPELEKWKDLDNRMYTRIGLDNELNTLSEILPWVKNELMSDYFEQTFGRDSAGRMSKDMINSIEYDWIGTRFHGKVGEYLRALIIINDTENSSFSPSLGELYDKFSESYPESVMLPALKTAMEANKRANTMGPVEGIEFIEADSVSSIADLIASYKGRTLMVDVWATWCGPCRESFAHAPEIQKFAADNGIGLLYISIDEGPQAVENSRKLVRYYDLKGSHLTISPELKMEVFKTYGNDNGILSIPAVAVYDRNGNRLVQPIDGEKLPSVLEALNVAL